MLVLLEDEQFAAALEEELVSHRKRSYPPRETLAMFVAQVLCDDPSLRRAVDERIVRDIARGVSPPSSSTAAYSDARVSAGPTGRRQIGGRRRGAGHGAGGRTAVVR